LDREDRQLSLVERWELDIESYKKGASVLTSTPQCEECKFHIKKNALHCDKFCKESKPKFVMFPSKECPEFVHKNPLIIKIENQFDEMVYSGILGFCIGDALGVPVEFTSREERKTDPIEEMRGYGTYHQHFGTWSDDTSLLLCLMDCINESYNLKRLSEKFIKFYLEAYLTPNGEVFDIGVSTRESIEKMIKGIEPEDCGGCTEMDNGNGSLMRVLPLAYYVKSFSSEKRKETIEQVSSLTHSHKRSKLACIFYVEFLIGLINKKSKIDAYSTAVDFVKNYCFIDYEKEFINFEKILNGKIIGVEEKEIKSTGYVIDTLEASIWSFFKGNDYKEVVLTSINLGGDTDTIAAIAGGLAGVYYGLESIPIPWKECLARNKEICKIIDDFIKTVSI